MEEISHFHLGSTTQLWGILSVLQHFLVSFFTLLRGFSLNFLKFDSPLMLVLLEF